MHDHVEIHINWNLREFIPCGGIRRFRVISIGKDVVRQPWRFFLWFFFLYLLLFWLRTNYFQPKAAFQILWTAKSRTYFYLISGFQSIRRTKADFDCAFIRTRFADVDQLVRIIDWPRRGSTVFFVMPILQNRHLQITGIFRPIKVVIFYIGRELNRLLFALGDRNHAIALASL